MDIEIANYRLFRKRYAAVKIGMFGKPGAQLFVRNRANDRRFSRVIPCRIEMANEYHPKWDLYVFREPCPFCGGVHTHGASWGPRVAHCPIRDIADDVLGIESHDYYVASESEFLTIWRHAVDITRLQDPRVYDRVFGNA